MRKVLCIPCGRRAYLSIMRKYVERDRHLFDECHLWVNCADEDHDYLVDWAESDPSFYKLVYLDDYDIDPSDAAHRGSNVHQFLDRACDPNTLYVKADDDTIFIEKGALEELIKCREDNPEYIQVIANTVNNAACAFFHQDGAPAHKTYGRLVCSGNGSGLVHIPELGALIQEEFLEKYKQGRLGDYRVGFVNWGCGVGGFCPTIIPAHYPPWYGVRWPNQVYAFFGRDYIGMRKAMTDAGWRDEEWYITVEYPRLTGRNVCYLGNKVVVHYSYNKQDCVMRKRADLLAQYAAIADIECAQQ